MAIVVAEGLGVRGRRGWIFRGVDLSVDEGEFVTVVGPDGSGRTSLLLALAGYFRTGEGTVTRTGPAALGFVAGVHEPEPGLSVVEHVEERLMLLGRAPWSLRKRRRTAEELLMAVPLEPGKLGRDLGGFERHLLCLTLARIGAPALVVADDVDSGLSEVERQDLAAALRETGAAVVVAAREGTGSVLDLKEHTA